MAGNKKERRTNRFEEAKRFLASKGISPEGSLQVTLKKCKDPEKFKSWVAAVFDKDSEERFAKLSEHFLKHHAPMLLENWEAVRTIHQGSIGPKSLATILSLADQLLTANAELLEELKLSKPEFYARRFIIHGWTSNQGLATRYHALFFLQNLDFLLETDWSDGELAFIGEALASEETNYGQHTAPVWRGKTQGKSLEHVCIRAKKKIFRQVILGCLKYSSLQSYCCPRRLAKFLDRLPNESEGQGFDFWFKARGFDIASGDNVVVIPNTRNLLVKGYPLLTDCEAALYALQSVIEDLNEHEDQDDS